MTNIFDIKNQINDRQYTAKLKFRYSSHNKNIKCVGSTIICIDFESIYYAINLDVVLSSMILILCFFLCIL